MTAPTPEQIAAWALEVGMAEYNSDFWPDDRPDDVSVEVLTRFAALVAAHAVAQERESLVRLLAEIDGYLQCVRDQSMTRNNAESLAGELQDEIRKHLTRNR